MLVESRSRDVFLCIPPLRPGEPRSEANRQREDVARLIYYLQNFALRFGSWRQSLHLGAQALDDARIARFIAELLKLLFLVRQLAADLVKTSCCSKRA